MAALAPCTTSAIRGPPATTTMKMPCSRPRTESSAALWSMLVRNAAEAMSAAPPMVSITSATISIRCCQYDASPTASPKPAIAKPQIRMQTITARPCASTRETQPEKTPPSTEPTGIAAKSSAKTSPPSSGPPKDAWAISGKSARGMPKTIAIRSTTKDIIRTGWPRR